MNRIASPYMRPQPNKPVRNDAKVIRNQQNKFDHNRRSRQTGMQMSSSA